MIYKEETDGREETRKRKRPSVFADGLSSFIYIFSRGVRVYYDEY